jgi:hypothetical protein
VGAVFVITLQKPRVENAFEINVAAVRGPFLNNPSPQPEDARDKMKAEHFECGYRGRVRINGGCFHNNIALTITNIQKGGEPG